MFRAMESRLEVLRFAADPLKGGTGRSEVSKEGDDGPSPGSEKRRIWRSGLDAVIDIG
jgi:hypothetical protein